MFTGIVETTCKVVSHRPDLLAILPRKPLPDLKIGESVAVSGVCLTLDSRQGRKLLFRLLPETRRVSTLADLRLGEWVNLERALRVGDRLGGHLMLGHVDGVGAVTAVSKEKAATTLEIRIPRKFSALLVHKGPIGVDGVSLTLDLEGGVPADRFQVHLVDHTLRVTNLGAKAVGSRVNIELDVVAKYLRGML